ncbi:penicillin-binding protein 2 [bacterium]
MWQNRDNLFLEIIFKHSVKKIYFVVILFTLLIACKLFYLQAIKRNYFAGISENNRIHIYNEISPRGKIFARQGEILVDNRLIYSIVLARFNYDLDILKESIRNLKNYLQFDIEKFLPTITKLQSRTFETIYIAKDVPQSMYFELKENITHLPGVDVVSEPIRRYRLKFLSAHFLGYLSEINSRELELLQFEGYRLGDLIGKNGIEKVYDEYLRGQDGRKRVEVNAKGRQIRILDEIKSKAGNDLYITIDYSLQKKAEELLLDKIGTIIALDPMTGEVLAMASSPGFDPLQFYYPATLEQKSLFVDERHPMMNRAIQSQYAPGSVFKLITTIAALEEKTIDKDFIINCEGKFYLKKGKRWFKCWKKEGHGKVNLKEALIHSCDVYYYMMGLKTGVANISKYARMFGLGRHTGIDLPFEKDGLIADPEWKKKSFNTVWFPGDTVNMSIGQGYVLTTPLQIANMTASVVNGGYLYRPYIVRKILSEKGKTIFENKPIVLRKIKVSGQTLDFVKQLMLGVVEQGTGRASRLRGIEVGGKTGTAENPHGDDHAWFVAAAPIDNPKIVVCAFIENGGHGGSVAAPLVRRMLKTFFKNNN